MRGKNSWIIPPGFDSVAFVWRERIGTRIARIRKRRSKNEFQIVSGGAAANTRMRAGGGEDVGKDWDTGGADRMDFGAISLHCSIASSMRQSRSRTATSLHRERRKRRRNQELWKAETVVFLRFRNSAYTEKQDHLRYSL